MTRLVAAGLIWPEGALRPGLAMEIAADAVVRMRPLATSEIPGRCFAETTDQSSPSALGYRRSSGL